jgi:type IV secretory pathway TrbL component
MTVVPIVILIGLCLAWFMDKGEKKYLGMGYLAVVVLVGVPFLMAIMAIGSARM